MTQEEKQLLLTDLCGRLPYGIKGYLSGLQVRIKILGVNGDYVFYKIFTQELSEHIRYVKPYLRPMSSMTKEEKKEFLDAVTWETNGKFYIDECEDITFYQEKYDWLNAHHFDYRGLIQKGLAISTEEFNPYKD